MLADSAREGYSYANFFAALTAFPVTFHRKLRVLSIIEAAGWPIWPLIICSVVALAIIGERLWSLRQNVVLPKNMLAHAIQAYRQNGVTPQLLSQLSATAPLGQILAAGLRNEKHSAAVMKESIEESSHAVAIELERFLTTLGTIAAISPLLGLFEHRRRHDRNFRCTNTFGHQPAGLGARYFHRSLQHRIRPCGCGAQHGVLPLLPRKSGYPAGRDADPGRQTR